MKQAEQIIGTNLMLPINKGSLLFVEVGRAALNVVDCEAVDHCCQDNLCFKMSQQAQTPRNPDCYVLADQ